MATISMNKEQQKHYDDFLDGLIRIVVNPIIQKKLKGKHKNEHKDK